MNNNTQNPLFTQNSGAQYTINPSLQGMSQLLAAQIAAAIVNSALQNNKKYAAPLSAQGQKAHTECNLNLDEHLKYADALVFAGIIDKNTGESIKKQMTANFQSKNRVSAPQAGANPSIANNNSTAAGKKPFNIEASSFLKTRECLLNYLKNRDIELDEEDLREIEDVALELEKAAIARQAAESAGHNADDVLKMLNQSNEIAKERLITDSLKDSGLKNPPKRTFTRDEIAKMSTAEFIKNEPTINYQLQNGLL